MYLIFDTETTGLPHNYSAPITDLDNWPRLVQIAWQLHDNKGNLLSSQNFIVKPEGFTIPYNSEKVHGISTKRALEEGHPLEEVLNTFSKDLEAAQVVIGHNIDFDNRIVGTEYVRVGQSDQGHGLLEKNKIDTAEVSTEFCQLQGGIGGRLKAPKLIELHEKLFGSKFNDAHDAAYDVDATAKCFFGLITQKVVEPLDGTDVAEITYEAPELADANFAKIEEASEINFGGDKEAAKKIDHPFSHLHVHSQFSVLQAVPDIKGLVAKAKEYNMPAVALTDLGNMFGAFKFVREALNNEIKPIVGCEFYVAEERTKLKFTKDNPDKRHNQVLIAKNKNGYHNLAKLSSLAYIEGLYGIYPRIDKDLIKTYSEDVIALTGGLNSEIPYLILNVGEHQAEEAFQWYLEVFKDDFYVEFLRHGDIAGQGLEEENRVNSVLLDFARKYHVKIIAANDVYYLDRQDAEAHDVLLCVKDGEMKSTPIGRGRGYRFGFPNNEYYFKSQEEMKILFSDIPEAIENLSELVDKIEVFKLDRDVLLPAFGIPDEFKDPEDDKDGGKRGENAFLRHLTYEGAKKRYPEITDEIRERLDFELETIKNTGYPGYFLIVQDFTSKAREMGVSVGPGRGSAAGSAVAYCIGITNVDPIAYDLLFERFLNPDRVSLPDIDIDFDDEGRDKVIQYVINKYGKQQVAQIITYGTMAAKSSIRDAARVMELSLSEANDLAKLVPEKPGTSLDKAFREVKELEVIRNGSDLKAKVLNQAKILEGSVRNTGTHACGVIITPDDLTKFIPVSTARDSEMLVTQFDNSVVENAGMLKMDFLGLKTLTIIKSAIANVKKRHGVEIDIDTIPLDDQKTYELYQRGETNGTFQFESPGMQKHLRALKPDKFEDLIAMNALYRPGPMEYIPNFIARKHGEEEITYDIQDMEEYLAETYGITVYQEQVMLLSQKLAGFSKGDADVLRKAMGKKIFALLEKLKPKFIDGGKERGHDPEVLGKVWKDWEAFAAYAFNKSHSTCYSLVAYQTAYLKAHYPAEYMAAVLTHNQSNIEKVTFFMEECRSLGIKVLGPHVNESAVNFAVNKEGEIRFGLGAIKGSGDAAVENIIEEREKNGSYKDIFDFAERVNLRMVNKKTFECLAMSGAFDCFDEYHRRQYLQAPENEQTLIEKVIKYANKMQMEAESSQASLFGGDTGVDTPKPKIPYMEPFGEIEKLNIERDVVGLYISGHPLDDFKFEIDSFCNTELNELNDLPPLQNKEVKVAGVVSGFAHRTTKGGKPFGTLTMEDYNGNFTFFLFGDDYIKFKEYLMQGWFLYIQGRVVERKWGDKSLEFKILNIELLNDLRDKRTKGLMVNINLNEINETVIKNLEEVCLQYRGDCALHMNLVDVQENISVEMMSRKFKVNPSNEMMEKMKQIPAVHCKVLV
ncbi:DNA polymerase III subunit alpha [Fulvivirga kasyanovii]|uniref:DNA polymerase III subunit alpha n=1 Tax=Fulvivirga kasyanovii TaxID=396812 RepID=A0ABW9RPR0_9BACT|nr:DNA polymerase III subunit alpha [Fulvivirga kasyanovii]MTI25978.1 DNA polymerase III subunit alpha [Fulvivirga kasyanovii]